MALSSELDGGRLDVLNWGPVHIYRSRSFTPDVPRGVDARPARAMLLRRTARGPLRLPSGW
eukprot:6790845-Alexandrium_andersonii.AAC.1